MRTGMESDAWETVWRNTACAAAAGFTTYTAALWFETGHPEPLFLVACAVVWILVSSAFLPHGSAS